MTGEILLLQYTHGNVNKWCYICTSHKILMLVDKLWF